MTGIPILDTILALIMQYRLGIAMMGLAVIAVGHYTDTYGRAERRPAAYELENGGRPTQRLGYLPKDSPRQTGEYVATLHRPQGRKRLEGMLSALKDRKGDRTG